MELNSKIKSRLLFSLGGLILVVLINSLFYSFSSFRFFYFEKWYPAVSVSQRVLFGWLPFSLGDIIYLIVFLLIILYIIRLFQSIIFFRKYNWKWLFHLIGGFNFIIFAYLFFIISWGYNYQRHFFNYQLNVKRMNYTKAELDRLCNFLLKNTNQSYTSRSLKYGDTVILPETRQLFNEAEENYWQEAKKMPVLNYHHISIKPSMYSYFLNFVGVSGYFNPFTGEAQVNTTIPSFLKPFVTCHEMAHQLGFAAEYEANFIGYLIASHSTDARFSYSANFDMLLYSEHALRDRDSTLAKKIWLKVDDGVQKDYTQLVEFYRSFNNPINPYISALYDQYLKANQQRKGIKSYNEVVGLLVAYLKKEGKI